MDSVGRKATKCWGSMLFYGRGTFRITRRRREISHFNQLDFAARRASVGYDPFSLSSMGRPSLDTIDPESKPATGGTDTVSSALSFEAMEYSGL